MITANKFDEGAVVIEATSDGASRGEEEPQNRRTWKGNGAGIFISITKPSWQKRERKAVQKRLFF